MQTFILLTRDTADYWSIMITDAEHSLVAVIKITPLFQMMAFLFSLEPSNRLQTASGCKQESVCRQRMMEVRGRKMKAVLRQKSVAKLHIFRIINSWIKINSSVWYSKQTLQHVEKWGLKCEICKTYHRFILCLVYEQCLPHDLYSFLCAVVSSRFFLKNQKMCERRRPQRRLLFKV